MAVSEYKGRVLVIAGSDSGGGAGIQADLKTVMALGGYATTALTALTAQNTRGVHGIHTVPPEFIAQQIQVVLEDIGADVIKIGMLGNSEAIITVAKSLDEMAPEIPIVLDPVMVAKGGAPLLQPEAIAVLTTHLLPRAALLTPNIPEAELLSESKINSAYEMELAGNALMRSGANAVLVKGGHLEPQEAQVKDVLVTAETCEYFTSPRIDSRHTHGTGCTLASAIATGLAHGHDLVSSVQRARTYVHEAISRAPGLGSGNGPLNHRATLE